MIRRTLFRLLVLATLLAMVGGGWYAWSGYRAAAKPQDVVTGYFAAVRAGDAAGALAFGNLPADVPHDWLTGAVLARQLQLAALDDVTVSRVERSGDTATVEVGYRLHFASGDRDEHGTVRVIRSHGRWRLASAAVAANVVVEKAQDRVSLAGADLPTGPVLLFPGALPVGVDTPYLQAAPASVGFGTATNVGIAVSPTAKAQRTIADNVVAQLTACLAGSHGARDCPLPAPRAVPGSLQGHVDILQRTVQVSLGSGAGGVLDVSGTITVRGTYRTLTFDNTEQVRTGKLTMPFHATASPFAPLRVYFGGDS